jgi:hypothetical protein
VYCSSALADDNTDKQITESALRETRDIISRELFGHYDITNLAVVKNRGPSEPYSARARLWAGDSHANILDEEKHNEASEPKPGNVRAR